MAELESSPRLAPEGFVDEQPVAGGDLAGGASSPSLLEMIAASTPAVTREAAPVVGAAEVAAPSLRSAIAPSAWGSGLGVAELLAVEGAQVRVRRHGVEGACRIPDFVDRELLIRALTQGDRVLVEGQPDGLWQVAGVLQTRLPDVVRIEGREIELVGAAAVTLKSGHAGLRLSADGQVEVIGSRIGVASRGLLRLVGRALRLN